MIVVARAVLHGEVGLVIDRFHFDLLGNVELTRLFIEIAVLVPCFLEQLLLDQISKGRVGLLLLLPRLGLVVVGVRLRQIFERQAHSIRGALEFKRLDLALDGLSKVHLRLIELLSHEVLQLVMEALGDAAHLELGSSTHVRAPFQQSRGHSRVHLLEVGLEDVEQSCRIVLVFVDQ